MVRLAVPRYGRPYRTTSFTLTCDANATDKVRAVCPDIDGSGTYRLEVQFRPKARDDPQSLCRTAGIVYQPLGQCGQDDEALVFIARVRDSEGSPVPASCLHDWEMRPPRVEVPRDKPSMDLALEDFTCSVSIGTGRDGACHHLAGGLGARKVTTEPARDLRGRLWLDLVVGAGKPGGDAAPATPPAATPAPSPTPVAPLAGRLQALLTPVEIVDGAEREIIGLELVNATLRLVRGTDCDGPTVATLGGEPKQAGISFAGDIEYQLRELATVHAVCIDLEARGYEQVQTTRLAHAPLESLLAEVTERPLKMTPHPQLAFRVVPIAHNRAVQGRPALVRLVRQLAADEVVVTGRGFVGQSIVLEEITCPAGSKVDVTVRVDGDEWTTESTTVPADAVTPTIRVAVGEPELDVHLRVTDAAHQPIPTARLQVEGQPVFLDPLAATGIVSVPESRWPHRLLLEASAECYLSVQTTVDAARFEPSRFGHPPGSTFDVVLEPAPPITYTLEVRFPRDGVDRQPISIDTVQIEHGTGPHRAWQHVFSSGADFQAAISCLDARRPVRYRVDAGDAFAVAEGELDSPSQRVLLRYARPVLLVALHPAEAWRDTELGMGTMWADFLRHLYNFVHTEVSDNDWAEVHVETVRHRARRGAPVLTIAPDLSERLSPQPFTTIGFVGGGPPSAEAVLERAEAFFASRQLPEAPGALAGTLVYIAPRDPSASHLDLLRAPLERLRDMGVAVVFVQIDRGELEAAALAEMRRLGLGRYRVHATASAADRFFRGVFEDLRSLPELSR